MSNSKKKKGLDMSSLSASSATMGDESQESRTRSVFLDCLRLIERLHRRLLDVLRARLEENGITEINGVQALLLYNIGDNEMSAGELRTRGYYLGSNVSYNLKKLVELGFVSHQRAEHDRRSVKVALTEKGLKVHSLVASLYDEQLQELLEDELIGDEALLSLRRNLRNLERYWADQLRFI